MPAGQIQLVTDLQARARPVADVPVPGDNGWHAAGMAVAKNFHAIGEQIGQMADKAAKGEGEAEGRVAGLDPEFRTRQDATLRNEAYNKAGLDIAETRLKTAIDGGIDKLEQAHGASPKALGSNIDAMLAGVLKNAPDELKPRLQMLGGAKKLVAIRGAERELTARTRADQQAAIQTELTDGFKSLSQMAFKAGLDGDADTVLQARVAALTAATRRTGLDGKPLLDPKAAEKMIQGVQDTVAEARLKGAFDRLETPAAKADFLRQLDADFKDSKGFAARFDLGGYQSLRRELEGEMRRAESTHNVVNRALAHQIASVREAAERGLPPAPDDLVKLKGAVVGKPELEKDLVEAEQTLKFVAGARRLRPEELDAYIRDETTRLNDTGVRTTGGEVERLKLAEKVLGNVHAEIKQDPLGWAGKVGLVDVAPLDTRSPQAVASALPTRAAQAEQVAAYYGQEPQYFRPDEKRRLPAAAAGGGKDLLDVVEVVAGAGPARSRRMFAELHEQGASTLALIGGLTEATGRRLPVVLDVADGVAFSRTKEFKGITEAGGTVRSHQRAIEVHNGALSGFPAYEQGLIDATNYAYAIRLQRANKTDDPDLWKQTFRELLGERKVGGDTYGGITSYRGQSVVLPPDVKQEKFGDLVGAMKPTDFPEPPVKADRSPASMAEIRGANLEPAGAGKYFLNVGSKDSPQYLGRADGGKFVLDLAEVKPELIKRRPDLYLDGGSRAPLPGMMKLGAGDVPPPQGSRPVGPNDPLYDMQRGQYDGQPKDDPTGQHFDGGGRNEDPNWTEQSGTEAWDAINEAAQSKWGRDMFPGRYTGMTTSDGTPSDRDQWDRMQRMGRNAYELRATEGGPNMKELLDNAWQQGVPMDMLDGYAKDQGVDWKPPAGPQPRPQRSWRNSDKPMSMRGGRFDPARG